MTTSITGRLKKFFIELQERIISEKEHCVTHVPFWAIAEAAATTLRNVSTKHFKTNNV